MAVDYASQGRRQRLVALRAFGPRIWHKSFGQLSAKNGAMDSGQHDPVSVIVGLFTKVKDYANQHITHVKNVVHEAGEMVVNGVTTLTNAILIRLAPETAKMIENAGTVIGGLEGRHFGQAAQQEIEMVLEMLKDPSTYGGLAVSVAATAVQGVPIVGQLAGGAVLADRVVGGGQAAVQAAEEIRAIPAGTRWNCSRLPSVAAPPACWACRSRSAGMC